MAAGDASRTWFSEMVETLRREWKPEMPWEEVIALRGRLDAMLKEIRFSRGIRPADDVVSRVQPAHTAGSAQRFGSISYICAGSFWHCRCRGSEIVGEAVGKTP
jgi:hypothetical protein